MEVYKMKVKEFNQLKREVKKGNVEGLKEVISDLTLSQAQAIEDMMLDLTLNEEMNKVLDELVAFIDSKVNEKKKVANKKAPTKPEKAPTKTKKVKPFNKVNVGDVVKFQVEGEELEHDIKIIYKGKYNIIGVMVDDEKEVFLVRKADFNKGIFNWKDRHGEEYNIIVIL